MLGELAVSAMTVFPAPLPLRRIHPGDATASKTTGSPVARTVIVRGVGAGLVLEATQKARLVRLTEIVSLCALSGLQPITNVSAETMRAVDLPKNFTPILPPTRHCSSLAVSRRSLEWYLRLYRY